jgi:hypothetical protein
MDMGKRSIVARGVGEREGGIGGAQRSSSEVRAHCVTLQCCHYTFSELTECALPRVRL